MKVYVVDTESDGLLAEATKIHCGVVANLNDDRTWKYRPHEIDQLISKLMSADVLIGHNLISHDLPLIEKLTGQVYKGKVVDTLIMSRLHKPKRTLPIHAKNKRAGPHSLYAWGVRCGRDKPDYDAWEEFDEDMLHRAAEDVEINKLTFFELMKEVKGQSWRDAHLLTFELFKNLHKQEQYGWLVDQPYMDKCIGMLTHWIERIDNAIVPLLPLKLIVEEQKVKGEYKYVQKPFKKNREYTAQVLNWLSLCDMDANEKPVVGPFSRINYRTVSLDSNDETKDYLLSQGWEPETWNYKKDKKGRPEKDERGNLIKTSPKLNGDDAFIGVSGKVGRLIAKRVQCRHRRSQIEGWKRLIRPDGRISARVSGVATTGRMKHSSIVNVPGGDSFFGRQMRRVFIAKPGYKIVGTDAASCQDRCLAARADNHNFTEMLLNGDKDKGTDGHSLNMQAINGVLVPRGFAPISRAVAKGAGYALKFGAGDSKLATTIGCDKATAVLCREAMAEVLGAQFKLVNDLTEEWRSNAKRKVNDWGKLQYYNGWIAGLDGRPIYIESEHQVLVYMLQSDEAILMSAAYNIFIKRCDKKGWVYGDDYGVVAWMHDELQIECKEEIAQEIAKLSAKCIVDASKFYNMSVPQAGESDIGNNWGETH